MKNLFIVCVFVVFGSGVFGQGIKFIEGEKWDNVLRMAQEQNKYIFMDCYTSWCGPCKALAKDVFTKNEVGNFFNSTFVNVKYDMEKDGSNYHGTLAELYRALGNKQKAEEHQKIDEQKQKEAEERFRKMFEKKE